MFSFYYYVYAISMILVNGLFDKSCRAQIIFYMFYLQSGYHSKVSIQNSSGSFYILGYVFQNQQRQFTGILNYWSSLFMLSIIRVFSIFGILEILCQGQHHAMQGFIIVWVSTLRIPIDSTSIDSRFD